jgi:hypothetical protein
MHFVTPENSARVWVRFEAGGRCEQVRLARLRLSAIQIGTAAAY